ncbi:head maturation protease, ClpP-related [Mesobacillus thioparans]|uniref:head maturation protease, ClpP-related n=1 Tax=Mesobacillus thioparans TaxID=370439 RepID=UPI0039F08FBD
MKINIKGPIISNNDQWIYDWFGIEAVSPKKITDQIEKANREDLEVEINSGGGSVFDASEIYAALKDYPGKVTGKIVGIAASAASVIAMAADKLLMAPTGQIMIHNASVRTQGDHRVMDHTADFLRNTNQTIANAYRLKSGKEYDELLAMMDKETWLTPQQALDHKLIDEIMFEGQVSDFVASADPQTGMLPKEVIEKVRNEMKSYTSATNQVSNPIVTPKDEEEKEIMNLEQLQNDHPDLYKQILNNGIDQGVTSERNRMKAIDDLSLPGYEEIINAAKYDSGISAEAVAVEIVKANKQQGLNYLSGAKDDAQTLAAIEGTSNQNLETEEEKAKREAEEIANSINKRRGQAR